MASIGLILYGCAASPDASNDRSAGRSTDSGQPVSTVVDARPAALVDGRGVTWGTLRPILAEIGGAQALDEHILDVKLAKETEDAGITIGSAEIQQERRLMLDTLDADPNTSVRLLNELRARQGLGPRRFEALLRRNASLRALIRDEVEITPATIEHRYQLVYGPRRQARIIVHPTLFDAQRTVEDLGRGADFRDLAVERSTDASAARGGLLEPISRVDPAYPDALRRALWSLEVDQVSRPILIDSSYAVIRVERLVPASETTLEEARSRIEQATRMQEERRAMDQLALRLIRNVQVTIFDEALNDAWTQARRRNERLSTAPSDVGQR
ncbi:MAG: peptidylprolyl isomerase [Planctomycetota bacterium]|jgi:parvulin-like peptidyl-prolyl isomerase